MSQRLKPDSVKEYNPVNNQVKQNPEYTVPQENPEKQGKIEDTLSYFWTKIGEKFDNLNKVFRYFDLQCVSF